MPLLIGVSYLAKFVTLPWWGKTGPRDERPTGCCGSGPLA